MIFCLRHTQSFSFHVFWTYIRLHPLSFFKLRIFDTCIIFFNGWIIYNALRMTDQSWYFPVPQTVWMTCLDHHSQRHISHKHILKLFYQNGVSMKIDMLEVSTVPPSYLPWNVHFEICWNSLDMSKRQIAGLLIISKKRDKTQWKLTLLLENSIFLMYFASAGIHIETKISMLFSTILYYHYNNKSKRSDKGMRIWKM